MSATAATKDPEPSRKRKGAEKPPPATPRLVDKNALSARSGEPQGDAGASPTSPPAKSARSSEAGSDEDEGMVEADKGAQMPATQPPEDGSWAAVARRRSPTAAAPAPASEQRGGASALATALALAGRGRAPCRQYLQGSLRDRWRSCAARLCNDQGRWTTACLQGGGALKSCRLALGGHSRNVATNPPVVNPPRAACLCECCDAS